MYLFIFGCVGSSWLCAGFLQLQRAGATLYCGARASHCGGFFCCGARALGAQASIVAACRLSSCGSLALERRLSSCDTRAQLLHGMWELPRPGIKPLSPALAGEFLTTAPPGKSQQIVFLFVFFNVYHCLCILKHINIIQHPLLQLSFTYMLVNKSFILTAVQQSAVRINHTLFIHSFTLRTDQDVSTLS